LRDSASSAVPLSRSSYPRYGMSTGPASMTTVTIATKATTSRTTP
jgi:hypothetical protein